MSRRRGEFEHRTSIFEGAFRAWSHLGGLEPEDLEEKPTAELDPLSNPIENDARLTSGNRGEDVQPEILNPNGTKRRIFPYEPLPRSGLAHPYVQAILSPWLGPDADNDAIQLGLTTLRTWWQHRRKGESGSAIAALGTEKMKGVIEGYTRHFFALAHCLVMNDKEQPPRTLQTKMKELEKKRNKMGKKKGIETTKVVAAGVTSSIAADLTNSALSPLERLHVAQQRNLGVDPGVSAIQITSVINPANPPISIKNKCVATKVNLPGIVDAVNRQANQLAHSGSLQNTGVVSNSVVSGSGVSSNAQYGDPDTFPIVFVAANGDILLAMSVEGITCAHCVKIVETVLKGCNGNKSPIDGLLDAAADHDLCSVIVKIDRVSSAKRVAFESARNLAMVGYTAKAKVMNAFVDQNGTPTKMPQSSIIKAFEAVGESDLKAIFDWNIPCSCPDNGVLRSDCSRHSQMGMSIFEAFEHRGRQTQSYLAAANIEPAANGAHQDQSMHLGHQPQELMLNDQFQPQPLGMGMNGGMELFVGSGSGVGGNLNMGGYTGMYDGGLSGHRAKRNSSIISFGGRALSIGEASYGRAMSGLSALSIDWENMDDFDLNVDHSAHINNEGMDPPPIQAVGFAAGVLPLGGGDSGTRRSSIRQFMVGGSDGGNDAHVSFKL